MPLRTLDHFVILVEALDAAIDAYERLGFHTRPIARHAAIGSSNSVIHLERTYLELFWLGDAGEPLRSQYAARLAAGPGLTHVSVDSADLEADRARMRSAGLPAHAVLSARRRIVRPDGSPDETASSFFYSWRSEHRYLSLFHSHHVKPDAIFIPEYAGRHANTAMDVTRAVWVSEHPAHDHAYFCAVFEAPGTPLTAQGFSITGSRGDISEVLTPEAAAARYGAELGATDLAGLGGLPAALHYGVRSLDECRRHLQQASVDVRPFGAKGVVVPARAACGVTTVFEAMELA